MTVTRPRRPDESMTLLTEMMQRPLDPGYAAEAARREAAGLPPTPQGRSWRMGVAMLVIGLLIATAAMALRQSKAVVAQQKSALLAQIERRQHDADATEARMRAWDAEIAAIQQRELTSASEQGLAQRLATVEGAAAATTVHGPGVVLTVDDAKAAGNGSADGNPRTGDQDPGKVQSSDLQSVVNGLWQSGAEAIDINGHRLTALSAIRFAGEAILVDYRPLTRPYVIHAIGDPAALPKTFAATDGAATLEQLGSQLGIQHTLTTSPDLTLTGDGAVTLRHATPVPTGIPTPGATRPAAPTTTRTTTTPTTTEAHP